MKPTTKAVRESQGLTRAEVAEKMSIDPPALSRPESGKSLNPTLATLHKWAEALGQTLRVDLQRQREVITKISIYQTALRTPATCP